MLIIVAEQAKQSGAAGDDLPLIATVDLEAIKAGQDYGLRQTPLAFAGRRHHVIVVRPVEPFDMRLGLEGQTARDLHRRALEDDQQGFVLQRHAGREVPPIGRQLEIREGIALVEGLDRQGVRHRRGGTDERCGEEDSEGEAGGQAK